MVDDEKLKNENVKSEEKYLPQQNMNHATYAQALTSKPVEQGQPRSLLKN